MTVERHCACGSVLEERGGALACRSCGAASRWLVRRDGELVAAADRGEVFVLPGLLREGLGVRQETLDRAATPDFERTVSRRRREDR